MLRTLQFFGLMMLLLASASGCSDPAAKANSQAPRDLTAEKAKYLLNEEPDGAVGVIIAREDAKDQDEIVLVARIGGRKEPFIKDRAAFMVIDASMTVVADGAESEAGQICMDDCCASLRADCTTLVKIVDNQGKPLAIDARQLLSAEENDMVVIKGKVERDEKEGAFTIAASGVYVRK
ncbi:hypothetical protein [Lignipirellula cremea]|uniref:Lipoprotein n=1 Tax=Lignipirellula cremea TaxID=2528010 RepID=A0A518DPM4_9BACT|nr:hypothetical protein [Lignipirellula cremea]QDU93797.1 hypothetical protein Pla8534_15800 [Lignipirellula cremea]